MMKRYLGARAAVAVMTSFAMLWVLAPAGVAAETPPAQTRQTRQTAGISAGGQLLGDGASISGGNSISAGGSGAATAGGPAVGGEEAGAAVMASGAAVMASGAEGTASLGLLGRLMVRLREVFATLFRGGSEAHSAVGAGIGDAGSIEAAGSVQAASKGQVQPATLRSEPQGSASRPSAKSGASASAAAAIRTATAVSTAQPGEGSGFLARISAGFNHVLGSFGILVHADAAANTQVEADAAAAAQVQADADAALTISGD